MGARSDAIRRYSRIASFARIGIYTAYAIPFLVAASRRPQVYPYVLALVVACTLTMLWGSFKAGDLQHSFNREVEAMME
jgi:hypothetical protein